MGFGLGRVKERLCVVEPAGDFLRTGGFVRGFEGLAVCLDEFDAVGVHADGGGLCDLGAVHGSAVAGCGDLVDRYLGVHVRHSECSPERLHGGLYAVAAASSGEQHRSSAHDRARGSDEPDRFEFRFLRIDRIHRSIMPCTVWQPRGCPRCAGMVAGVRRPLRWVVVVIADDSPCFSRTALLCGWLGNCAWGHRMFRWPHGFLDTVPSHQGSGGHSLPLTAAWKPSGYSTHVSSNYSYTLSALVQVGVRLSTRLGVCGPRAIG
jgi:hypothetical protein